jgi:hypothetical protein
MIDDEFLSASIAAKRAHFPGIGNGRFLPYLTFLDGNGSHHFTKSLS